MYETIRLLYRYSSWAMQNMFDALEKLSAEQYNAPGCSGNGSTKETLAHLLSTYQGWFSWLEGSKTQDEAMQMKVKEDDIATIAAARKKWELMDQRTHLFLEIQTEESLKVHRSFKSHSGQTDSLPLGELLLQIANHGTHTRAQIVAAIRRAGIDPGNYELLRYLMTRKGERVT